MCQVELEEVWRLIEEAEPSTDGLHKYRQVMRFFLETGSIRYRLAVANRNRSKDILTHVFLNHS